MQPNLFAFHLLIGEVVGNGNSLTFLVNMQAFINEIMAKAGWEAEMMPAWKQSSQVWLHEIYKNKSI